MQSDNQKVPYGYGSIPPRPTRNTELDGRQHMLEMAVLIQARSIDELAVAIAVLRNQIGELVRLAANAEDDGCFQLNGPKRNSQRQQRTRRICSALRAPRDEVCRMPMPPPVWRPGCCEGRSDNNYTVTVGVLAPLSVGLLWLAFVALGRNSFIAALAIGFTGAAMLIVSSLHRWYASTLLGVPAVALFLAALVCWDGAKTFAALAGVFGLALGFGALRAIAQPDSTKQ